jgi:hypothetical protein
MNNFASSYEVLNKLQRQAFKLVPTAPTVSEYIDAAIEMNEFIVESYNRELANIAKKYSNISNAF